MAAMLAFGASAYLLLFTPSALKRALSPAIRRIALASAVVALVTGTLWLGLDSASMADDGSAALDPQMVETVLLDSEFGHVWVAHLLIAAALVPFIALGPRDRWASTAILSGGLLASLGFVGHAAMQTGAEGLLHRSNHALHLLSTGWWIGGLVPFIMCLNAYRTEELRRDAVAAMVAFSFWGQFVVAAIILTGMANIALTSGRPPLPPSSPYRALLDAKIVLVGAMILLALCNRYGLAPRLRPGDRRSRPFAAQASWRLRLGRSWLRS